MGRLKRWRLRRAYRLVLKDISKQSGLYRGIYDARSGSDSFMYGVLTVMETLAFEAGDFDFGGKFLVNMTNSQVKAGIIHDEDQQG